MKRHLSPSPPGAEPVQRNAGRAQLERSGRCAEAKRPEKRGRGSGRGLTLLLFLTACEPEPDFPADYTKSFVEVRNCRNSAEHDSHFIRILASPEAVGPYRSRDGGFPAGAIVLKEERDFGDTTCSGPIIQWSAMKVQADGGVNGWHWQSVSPERHVLVTNGPKCTACHASCGQPPDGYAGTCAVP